MNLVAKEYVASQDPADPGVLILSKFAGAAAQLTDAVLVNPYDLNDMTQGLRLALEMPADERLARHAKLESVVREFDSEAWSSSYFAALVQAGNWRLGKASHSSPELDDALNRLRAIVKKDGTVARFAANAGR